MSDVEGGMPSVGVGASSSGAGEDAGLRSLSRALDVLSLLSAERPELATKEFVDATGLPKSTVVRLLQSLERKGLLWVNQDRKYVAGPVLLRWSRLATEVWRVSAAVHATLEAAAEEWGETAHVYVRRGVNRLCIAQHEGRHALRHVVRVGDEVPLWSGGASRVLLIGASPERMRYVAATSPRGIAHLDALAASVRQAAVDGYAASEDEPETGLSSVAVPIRAGSDHVMASLSIGGPSGRVTAARVPSIVQGLTRMAAELGEPDFGGLPQSSFPSREGPGRSWADPIDD